MFCYRCGTKLKDESIFCHKCGAKIPDGNIDKKKPGLSKVQNQKGDVLPELTQKREAVVNGQAAEQINASEDYAYFREFVNRHIKENTKFQSAEELLGSHVPQIFMWLCFGIPIIMGLMSYAPLVAWVFYLFLGYLVSLLVDLIMGFRAGGGARKINGKVNPDELIQFLNSHLGYLSPYFHEWGHMNYSNGGVLVKAPIQNVSMGKALGEAALVGGLAGGVFLKQAITAQMLNSANASAIKIGTEFGNKKRCYIVIWIWPNTKEPDSNQMKYYFRTGIRSLLYSARYTCMVKAVPILQAAMEYYLNEYKTREKFNDSVKFKSETEL